MARSKSATSQYWIFVPSGNSEFWGRSDESLRFGYDIFRDLHDGSQLWLAHTSTLSEAQDKLAVLAGTLPANYFIRDATSNKIVVRAGSWASANVRT
jgi:hypothetical protein